MGRRVRTLHGWTAEKDSWLNCRSMCHESQKFCWYPLKRAQILITGYKPTREVRYSPTAFSSILSLNDEHQQPPNREE